MYFGVGLRHLSLTYPDGKIENNKDAEANGIAFNLGYFSSEYLLEYSRQTTIVNLETPQQFQEKTLNHIGLIQNNLWYFELWKLGTDFYLSYGGGLQFAQIRPKNKTTSFASVDENSIAGGVGASYFLIHNLMLMYRFTSGYYLSAMNEGRSEAILLRTQVHTFFLEYYFPL